MTLSGNLIDYLNVFLGGVAVSFTPCVYPLFPITAGYIGTRAAGSKIQGFILSLIYVTGMAVTYSCLGIIASLTGTLFGRISSRPIVYIFVGAVIIFYGLLMFDLFQLNVPPLFKLAKPRKNNYWSAFVLGLSSGLIASPCLTPVLGTILIYLTTQKNVIYGATLLFTFAYGMGLMLILIGTSSSLLLGLPKSGKWLAYVKKIGASILIAMGAYFIYLGIRRM